MTVREGWLCGVTDGGTASVVEAARGTGERWFADGQFIEWRTRAIVETQAIAPRRNGAP